MGGFQTLGRSWACGGQYSAAGGLIALRAVSSGGLQLPVGRAVSRASPLRQAAHPLQGSTSGSSLFDSRKLLCWRPSRFAHNAEALAQVLDFDGPQLAASSSLEGTDF